MITLSKNKPRTKKNYHGFTLVELIVVITILVILGTISFLQLGGFAASARDSTRVSNLTNLKTGLDLFQIKSGTYPIPENPVSITASGTTIGYQGFAKDQIGNIAKLSVGGALDPLDTTMYTTYSVNTNQTKMQIMSFLEDGSTAVAFVPTTYASTTSDYSKRYSKTLGDTLGILLSTATGTLNQPVQETTMTGIDLTKTTTLSGYTMIFSKNDTTASIITNGTGAYTGSLFTFAYNKRDDLLNNKALAVNDQSLVGYWDMETLTGGLLKDLSGYRNNGVCYNSGTIVTCAGGNGGPQIVEGNGKTGMAMDFNGFRQSIITANNNSSLNISNMTLVVLYKERGTGSNKWLIDKRPVNTSYAMFLESGLKMRLNSNDCTITEPSEDKYNLAISTYEGTRMRMYLNGIKTLETLLITSFTHNSQGIGIGQHSGPGVNNDYSFNGLIDEVRIYNRALSDSEIQTLYNATK